MFAFGGHSILELVLDFFFALRVEFQGLVPDHLLQAFLCWLEVIPTPIEWLLTLGLDLLIVQAFEVRVFKALLDGVPFFGVENQHFSK